MTARQKIEWLTNNWYGFAVVAAVVSIFQSGFGIFSMFLTGAGLAFSLGLTWLLGKMLLARSSMTRFILVIASMIGTTFHALVLAWYAWDFLANWKLAVIFKAALSIALLVMHVRSFKVLSDKDVKSYIAS